VVVPSKGKAVPGDLPYRPRRPDALEGIGPLEVFRAISAQNQNLHQEPRFWARVQWTFNRLLAAPDPAIAAAAHANPQCGDVPKLWAEVAFEIARRELAPEKPSRLESLYAWFDPIEAFLFIDDATVGAVWRGAVPDGVRWVAANFTAFDVLRPPAGAAAGAFAEAWDALQERARCYWLPTLPIERAEVLVDGVIDLVEKVKLRTLLADAGFLEAAPAVAHLEPEMPPTEEP
jgi:hypothetical protein